MQRIFCLALIAAASAAAMLPPATASEQVVEIANFTYSPSRLDASPGDTVTWINRDIVPHTASADDGAWDSGRIDPGESRSVVLPAIFERGYYCRYHPAMRAGL